MFDSKYVHFLEKFKDVTNEDFFIAGLINQVVDTSNIKKVLDIGAGTGIVSLGLEKIRGKNFDIITAVEMSKGLERLYPERVQFIGEDFLDIEFNHKYDFIIMSQVIGDIQEEKRKVFLEKATIHLEQGGYIVAIENGPNENFDAFIDKMLDGKPMPYSIDFNKYEKWVEEFGLQYTRHDFQMLLKIATSKEEFLENCNALFPYPFKQGIIDESFFEKFKINNRSYALPITERVYVISHQNI